MATDKTSAQFYEEAILEETSGPSNVVGQTFYEPESPEAKALDRAVNLKLDFAILIVLAINFILCGIDKVRTSRPCSQSLLLILYPLDEHRLRCHHDLRKRRPPQTQRRQQLRLPPQRHIRHSPTIFHRARPTHRPQVLDPLYDAHVGSHLHGPCRRKEQRHIDRASPPSWCCGSWIRSDDVLLPVHRLPEILARD